MGLNDRFLYFAGKIVPGLFGFATTALLTRLLTPQVYGIYALGLSVVLFVTLGVFEWLGMTALRFHAAADHERRFAAQVLLCFTGLCAVLTAITLLFLPFGSSIGPGVGFLIACLFASIGSAWFELATKFSMARFEAKRFFLANAARGLATFTLIAGTAMVTPSPTALLLATGVGLVIATLFVPVARLPVRGRDIDRAMLRQMLRFGLPFAVSIVLSGMLISLDRWMIGLLVNTEAVGYFNAAFTVAQLPLTFLASGIGPAAYTLAVRAEESGNVQATQAQLANNLITITGLLLPAAVGIAVLAPDLARYLVGPAFYTPVVELAPLLALAALLANLRTYYVEGAFQLARNTRPLIWILGILVMLEAGLDVALIPAFGLSGVGMAQIAVTTTGLIIAYVASRSRYTLPLPWHELGKLALGAVTMCLGLALLPRGEGLIGLVVEIVAGAVIYGVTVVALDVLGYRGKLYARLFRPAATTSYRGNSGRF